MKSITAAIGAATLAFTASITGAQAQNQMGAEALSNPTNIVKSFSVQTVGPVLNEMGMPWQVNQLDNGAQYILAASGSMQFVLFFTVCQASNCAGMNVVTFFSGVDANPQTVQAFNSRFPFGTAGIDQDGVAYVSRYDIADYGIPRGNIAISVGNFLSLSEMFAEELANAHQTVSLEGYADDLSSSHLNRQTLRHFSGVKGEAATSAERHREGFEDGAQMIQMLLNSYSTPRNKIENKHD